jgi:hypothetical protein
MRGGSEDTGVLIGFGLYATQGLETTVIEADEE